MNNERSLKLPKFDKTASVMVLFILISCFFVALMQAGGFHLLEHRSKIFILTLFFVIYIGFLCYFTFFKGFDENTSVIMVLLLGVFLRCSFVLLSGLYERQHDAGAYTGYGTEFINPGHIGYIEYIYKFGTLPNINPYTLFGYYHPPLHHIISFLFLKLNLLLGTTEEIAFENLQILPLFYSNLLIVVTYKIMKLLDIRGIGLVLGLLFLSLHPGTIYMAGSVNNDMLTILFMALIMLATFRWIRNKSRKTLIPLALYIGFGMITKLNAAVLAIPIALLFLMHLIQVIKEKQKETLFKTIKDYLTFAIIVFPIGLSWIVRNLIRFKEKPGVPVPGETSPMYTRNFSLWERLGIPSLHDWHFDFPFHPISANACANTWAIMFHTSLFAEEYPTDLSDVLLSLCQIAFVMAVISACILAVLLLYLCLKKSSLKEDRIFLSTGYIIMLISFMAFVIVYPYTCSADFRYVAITLVYMSVTLGLGNKLFLQDDECYLSETGAMKKNHNAKIFIIVLDILTMGALILVTLVSLLWGRW